MVYIMYGYDLMGGDGMDKIKQAQINGFLQAFALLNLHGMNWSIG